ncbi:hypothetical protein CN890_10510 [Priestia megaterium]|uniref:hypothetical protein n=1 Tax=Priestia megaterium TaxID=1404 RepID=UPI000BFBEB62|nr:hypothetical protein [Priestia megaterium]PGH72716.1 hypothetical protein CN890_10510 [Priestia megaterium]
MEKLIYKGISYSPEDLKEDYRRFSKDIESHNDFISSYMLAQSLETYDHGYSRAGNRIYALHELLLTAKFSLYNSYKKIHDDLPDPNENYLPHLLRRSHYLKNAIIWYSSCQDYVLQIVSLSYDLHGVQLTSAEKYKEALKNCSYRRVTNKLSRIDSENSLELLRMIEEYGSDKDVEYLREELANNLKHHGNLKFKGIAVGNPGFYTEKDAQTGNTTYSSDWTESLIVDIDEVNELIKRVHNLLITHIREVLKFIDFEACIPTGEKKLIGEKRYWVTKEKHEYRKILC